MENIYFNEQEKNKKSFLFIDNSRVHTWNTQVFKKFFLSFNKVKRFVCKKYRKKLRTEIVEENFVT